MLVSEHEGDIRLADPASYGERRIADPVNLDERVSPVGPHLATIARKANEEYAAIAPGHRPPKPKDRQVERTVFSLVGHVLENAFKGVVCSLYGALFATE